MKEYEPKLTSLRLCLEAIFGWYLNSRVFRGRGGGASPPSERNALFAYQEEPG
jgi:hypothetical protein